MLGHGIVNEVYYPRIDISQIRDPGFIVGDGAGYSRCRSRCAADRLVLESNPDLAVHVLLASPLGGCGRDFTKRELPEDRCHVRTCRVVCGAV